LVERTFYKIESLFVVADTFWFGGTERYKFTLDHWYELMSLLIRAYWYERIDMSLFTDDELNFDV
jgi:hypothetical protein